MNDFFKINLTAKDYRQEAKRICDVYVDKLAFVYLVYLLILGVSGIPYVGSIFGLVCGGPFAYSLAKIAKYTYQNVEPKVVDIFDGFNEFTKTFLIALLQGIFVFLWSLLLIIPGIVKSIAYSMSYYVSLDNKNLKASECLKESQRIMQGHKMELFCLMLSYFGWLILCGLTLGILTLWVGPRIEEAKYLFYLKITGKHNNSSEDMYSYNDIF